MLEKNGGTLRTVAWSEICPWLIILRAFRLAVSLRVLVLAAVAIFLTFCGWTVLGMIFYGDEATGWMSPSEGCPWVAVTSLVPNEAALPGDARFSNDVENLVSPAALTGPGNPFFGSWRLLSRPAWGMFGDGVGFTDAVCLLLCGLWSLAIWAFFGGAITRIGAVQLACDERIGWAAALRHARSKWFSYFSAPLFPAIGILAAALPVLLLGLMLKFGFGVLLTALVWPLALVAGLVMVVLLLGLLFGWPLMWATISAEGTDNFDALSRCYAYVFQRPLRYLFYAMVAAFFGAVGWLLVSNFAAGVVDLSYWAASWGSNEEVINEVMSGYDAEGKEVEGIGEAGAVVLHFWDGCIRLLGAGFFFGYFWIASTAVYFLLRRDVDATEMDEVFLDQDASEQAEGLPPLTTDETGAPVVDEPSSQAGGESGAEPPADMPDRPEE